VVNRLEIKRCG